MTKKKELHTYIKMQNKTECKTECIYNFGEKKIYNFIAV